MPLIRCRKCNAMTSDEYSYCTHCQTPIPRKASKSESREAYERTSLPPKEDVTPTSAVRYGIVESLLRPLEDSAREKRVPDFRKTCVSCGAPITPHLKFCSSCGHHLTIDVARVLDSTFKIMREQPVILLPIFLGAIMSALISSWSHSVMSGFQGHPTLDTGLFSFSFAQLLIVSILFRVFVVSIVFGMYPEMVRDAARGERINVSSAFRKSLSRFPSLSASYVLIVLLLTLGIIALIVPGIILATWYCYTFPAIMLEDRSAADGMSASKAFARDKKWETFTMLLVASASTLVGSLMLLIIPISDRNGLLYFTINLLFSFPSLVLVALMTSYVYITYAMPREKV